MFWATVRQARNEREAPLFATVSGVLIIRVFDSSLRARGKTHQRMLSLTYQMIKGAFPGRTFRSPPIGHRSKHGRVLDGFPPSPPSLYSSRPLCFQMLLSTEKCSRHPSTDVTQHACLFVEIERNPRARPSDLFNLTSITGIDPSSDLVFHARPASNHNG
jgi:hypothetical protein